MIVTVPPKKGRRLSPACLISGRNIWTNRACYIADRHCLEPYSSRSGNYRIEEPFSAEENVLHSRNRLDIHIAGCLHCGQMSGVDDDLLAWLQAVFYYVSVKFRKDDSLSADSLHDKSFSSKQAGSYFFAEMYR